jgi:hypothetical protein
LHGDIFPLIVRRKDTKLQGFLRIETVDKIIDDPVRVSISGKRIEGEYFVAPFKALLFRVTAALYIDHKTAVADYHGCESILDPVQAIGRKKRRV